MKASARSKVRHDRSNTRRRSERASRTASSSSTIATIGALDKPITFASVAGWPHPRRDEARMHAPLREQHRWLRQVLNGHYQYFGVIFNYRSLRVFKACVVKDWRKVLGKRSQKGCINWVNYRQLLIAFPLPEPVIHQAWRQ